MLNIAPCTRLSAFDGGVGPAVETTALDVVDGSDATSIAVFEASSFQVEAMAEAMRQAFPALQMTFKKPEEVVGNQTRVDRKSVV